MTSSIFKLQPAPGANLACSEPILMVSNSQPVSGQVSLACSCETLQAQEIDGMSRHAISRQVRQDFAQDAGELKPMSAKATRQRQYGVSIRVL